MERFFRKEYLPAILLYVASALFFIASGVMLYKSNIHWATVLILSIAVMLLASSSLVKIGKKLREDDEKENEEANEE